MYIKGISGYLSKYEGTEVDAAVERTQRLDEEFALKVDKTTTVNDQPLSGDVVITADDIGALSDTTKYGASLDWNNGVLYLRDQDGVPLSSEYITTNAYWGQIYGDISNQTDLSEALAAKYDASNPDGFISGITSSDVTTALGYTPQEELVSGTNIKTINSTTLLGSGNIDVLANTATGSYSLTVGGTASTATAGTNVGISSAASGGYSTAIGYASSGGARATGLGWNAKATGTDSIQIGNGTNSNAKTLSVGFYNTGNYELLDGTTGLIPDARISSNIARTSELPTIDQTYNSTSTNPQSGTAVAGAISTKQDTITSSAMLSSDLVDDTNKTHKFATAAQLSQIATNQGDISTINGKIPAAASTSNQLADKNYVNSSIATNTANFIGTFDSLAELEAYTGTVTNNDYAFVATTDTSGNTLYDRYKYTTATTPASWEFEYELNNSSFTSAQWAAINSGATTTNIGQITTNQNAITAIDSIMGGYGDIVTHNVSEFATSVQGGLADTALQPGDVDSSLSNSSTNPVQNKVIYSALGNKQDSSTAVTHTASTAVGDTITPIYVNSSGVATALGYTIEKSVPSDAVFTDTTYSDFTGATSVVGGAHGLVPAPSSGDNDKILTGGATWSAVKTVNNNSLLGSGNVAVQETLVSGTNIKTINSTSLLGSGNIDVLANAATGTSSLTIGGTATANDYSINLGYSSSATAARATAVGYGSQAGAARSTAIGFSAKTSGATAIQIGAGTNSTANTLSVGFYNQGNYELLDGATGLIPDDRISSNIQRTGTAVTHTASTAVGNSTTPVYIASDGTATALSYTIAKSVPSDAVFTDTTYSNFTGADSTTGGAAGLVPAPSAGDEGKFLQGDGTWSSALTGVAWGDITGTLANQTDLNTALGNKQDSITGAATSITSSNLTASRALVSDSSGKVAVSSITSTKLGYLTDVTSNIQAQLNGKTTMSDVEAKGYITGITSSDVTTALNYTPYDASNPDGFISSAAMSTLTDVTLSSLSGGQYLYYDSTASKWKNKTLGSTDITTALNYTPYDATNPNGYISSAALSTLTDTAISSPTNGQHLIYDSTSGKWKNETSTQVIAWGDITGTLANQTDLNTALGGKQDSITGAATSITSSDLTASRALVSDSSGKVAASSITSTKLGYLTDVTSNIQAQINGKQATLVSGTNIKTINNNSVLGSGNITIDSLPSQTGNSGKYLTTNGTSASWAALSIPETYLQNMSTVPGSLGIISSGAAGDYSIAIGSGSGALGDSSVAIGAWVEGENAIAIGGYDTTVYGDYSIGIGGDTSYDNCIQLGPGTNDTTNTFQVGSYTLLNTSTGYIPNARINMDTVPGSGSDNAVTSGAVYTALADKQDTLVSGTNIKTINSTSLLGSGNIKVLANASDYNSNLTIDGVTITSTPYTHSVNIGASSKADGARVVALGVGAEAGAGSAIQLGYGRNSTSNSLSIGFYNNASTHYNWQLLDGTTGYIPNARINMDTVPGSGSGNAITSGAVYTALSGKQNSLSAGSNITISGDTISATDTTYSDFTGATSIAGGAAGLVPAPSTGDEVKFLKGDGTWGTVVTGVAWGDITGTLANQTDLSTALSGKQNSLTAGSNITISGDTISATDTTYSNFTGATSAAGGAAGLVPAPSAGDDDAILTGGATWSSIPTVLGYTPQDSSTAVTHTASTAVGDTITPVYIASNGAATALSYTIAKSVPSDAVFTDTTYSDFTGATSVAGGVHGLVPAPSTGDNDKILTGGATWSSVKTINSTSLLGSGNIAVADTTLSNVSSIDSNSAVKTALDDKVEYAFVIVDYTAS